MGDHNALYGGPRMLVGCSLVAFKYVCARARPATSRECGSAPLGQSGVRPWGRAFLCGGPAPSLPPAPPSPFVCPSMCVGVSIVCECGVRILSFIVVGSVAVLGAPRSSSVLRALARMPDAARCPPLPASARALCARVVTGCAPGASWRAVGPSALNGPVRAPRAPSRLLYPAFGLHQLLNTSVFATFS